MTSSHDRRVNHAVLSLLTRIITQESEITTRHPLNFQFQLLYCNGVKFPRFFNAIVPPKQRGSSAIFKERSVQNFEAPKQVGGGTNKHAFST